MVHQGQDLVRFHFEEKALASTKHEPCRSGSVQWYGGGWYHTSTTTIPPYEWATHSQVDEETAKLSDMRRTRRIDDVCGRMSQSSVSSRFVYKFT